MKPGDRIRIRSTYPRAHIGALGYVDHAVPEFTYVYDEPGRPDLCWSVRLDDHSTHLQWESELELVEE